MLCLRPAPCCAVVAACAVLLAWPGAAWAQALAAPPPLRNAVRAVWANAPEVRAAAAELAAARARGEAAAQPFYNPELSLEAENADVNRRAVGISLPLDVSGKRRARATRGAAETAAAEAAFALQRREVAARWLKAWTATALAGRQAALGRQRLQLMQRFDDLAAQRLRVGDISSPERDLAGLVLGEAQAQQAALRGQAAAAAASLRAIAGDTLSALPELPDDLPPAPDAFAPRPLDALPELVQAQAEGDAAEAGVSVARRARVPDPSIGLTGGEVRAGNLRDRIIGISVSVPLPVRNTGSAEVAAARAGARAAAARVEAQRQVLAARRTETRTRYAALREAAAAFRAGRAGALEPRTALLEKLWRAGEVSTADYLLQLKQSLDVALSGLDLESQAWQAWFDQLAAAGRLGDWLDGTDGENP